MGGRNSSMMGGQGGFDPMGFLQMLTGRGMPGAPGGPGAPMPMPGVITPPVTQTPGYGQGVPQFGQMPPDQLAQYNQQQGTGPVTPPPSPFGRRSTGMGGLFGRSRGGM